MLHSCSIGPHGGASDLVYPASTVGGSCLSSHNSVRGEPKEESMTNLELYLIANALTKLVNALERLVWAVRQP